MSNRAMGSGSDLGTRQPSAAVEHRPPAAQARTDGAESGLGTSPHGLSAELLQAHQETLESVSLNSPAKPLLTSPEIYRSPQVLESCRIIEAAAAKQSSGFFGLTLTPEQCRHLAFAALCQVESLQESYEAHEPEVQDAIRCLLEVQRMMKRAATKHAYKTGQAKGGSSWRKDGDSLFDKEAYL